MLLWELEQYVCNLDISVCVSDSCGLQVEFLNFIYSTYELAGGMGKYFMSQTLVISHAKQVLV